MPYATSPRQREVVITEPSGVVKESLCQVEGGANQYIPNTPKNTQKSRLNNNFSLGCLALPVNEGLELGRSRRSPRGDYVRE